MLLVQTRYVKVVDPHILIYASLTHVLISCAHTQEAKRSWRRSRPKRSNKPHTSESIRLWLHVFILELFVWLVTILIIHVKHCNALSSARHIHFAVNIASCIFIAYTKNDLQHNMLSPSIALHICTHITIV